MRLPQMVLQRFRSIFTTTRKYLHNFPYVSGSADTWRQQNGYYTFDLGGFSGGTKDRPAFAARYYYEISQLEDTLSGLDLSVDRSAEVGSGYGRVSPWIARHSAEHYGVEPNTEVLESARELYPGISWREEKLPDLSFESNSLDLIVTWTVLQHIPPASIGESINEIERVATEGGTVIICEETQGEAGSHTWPRSVEEYNAQFENSTVVDVRTRCLEPTYGKHAGEIIIFEVE